MIELAPQFAGDWPLIAGWVFIAHAADELASSREIGSTPDEDLPQRNRRSARSKRHAETSNAQAANRTISRAANRGERTHD